MEWVAVTIAVVVLVALGVRCVIGKMQEAAQKYCDAVARDEIESVKAWLEQQRHG